MAERIPPEVQQHLIKLQQLQAQLNNVLTEKNMLEQELREVNRALEVLKDVPEDGEVYRVSGHLLVRIKKSDAEKELNERKELLELRLKTLERQENLLRQQISELQSKISQMISKRPAGG